MFNRDDNLPTLFLSFVNELDVCHFLCIVLLLIFLSFVNEVEYRWVIDKLECFLFFEITLLWLFCYLLLFTVGLVDLAMFTLIVFNLKLGFVGLWGISIWIGGLLVFKGVGFWQGENAYWYLDALLFESLLSISNK